MSSLLGASLVHPEKLFFGIVGDLSFFYDINVLGNRHVGNNIRILLINNGLGNEFRLYTQYSSNFGEETDKYISAAGHFGNKSHNLVKHYAEDLGYEYLTASNKEKFEKVYERFIAPEITSKPIIFEVFTEVSDENEALFSVNHIEMTSKDKLKQTVKNMLGESIAKAVKNIIKK